VGESNLTPSSCVIALRASGPLSALISDKRYEPAFARWIVDSVRWCGSAPAGRQSHERSSRTRCSSGSVSLYFAYVMFSYDSRSCGGLINNG